MQSSRRFFLRQLGGVVSILIGGAQLAGCLGESDSGESASQQPADSSASSAPTAQPAPSALSQQSANTGPVWEPSPAIEFVEGVPAVVSVRQFVQDPNQDPLVIQLRSGTLLPGITWNPNNATIAYDGRPLGARPNQPVVVNGVTFSADDGRN